MEYNYDWRVNFRTPTNFGFRVDYVAKLRSKIGNAMKELYQSIGRGENQFRVLNHGDCWVNNILFKYDLEEDTIGAKWVPSSFPSNYGVIYHV